MSCVAAVPKLSTVRPLEVRDFHDANFARAALLWRAKLSSHANMAAVADDDTSDDVVTAE